MRVGILGTARQRALVACALRTRARRAGHPLEARADASVATWLKLDPCHASLSRALDYVNQHFTGHDRWCLVGPP